MTDRDDGLTRALDRGEDVVRGGAWREALVDPELDVRRLRDRGGGLAGAEERARQDELRPLPDQPLAERTRLLAAPCAERTELIGIAGFGVGVADEDQSHR